jgi:hypothetical protein
MIDKSKGWPQRDVVRAVGLPVGTLVHWLDRHIIAMRGNDIEPGGSGKPRQFSRNRVEQVAITHALTQLGTSPSVAAEAAAHFTDHSQPGRPAGELFPSGATWLVVSLGRTVVTNVEPGATATDLLSGALLGVRPDAVIVLDVGRVVDRVTTKLKAA